MLRITILVTIKLKQMKNKFNVLIWLLFVGVTTTWSQNLKRKYISFDKEAFKLEVEVNDGTYMFKSYGEKIVETTFIPDGQSAIHQSHALAVAQSSKPIEVKEALGYIECNMGEISIMVVKNPFQIIYYYNGKVILSEREGYKKNDTHEIIDFNLESSEALYGGGARALGLNRRGNRLELYNKAHYGYENRSELMNYTMPLVMSSKLYAVHFDNPAIGYLDLDSKKDNSLQYETIGGRKTYQLVVGENWKDLINQYTTLTGKQPIPPRWVFGNFASRFGYHSQAEVEKVVSKFRKENIPLDAIILDLYWFGKEVKGTMGNLEFHKDSFPDYQGMISNLKGKGVKTILITEPFILTTSKKWNEAVEKGVLATDAKSSPFTYEFFFGNTGLIDIFKPEARTWFWDIYKKYTADGVAGWWGDLGEPEVHPKDLMHVGGSADYLHNIYGHSWAKLVYEGYQKGFPEQRPFILMRSGYSGTQRYGIIPWSGDVNRTWGGLQSQPEISLEMGMQGLAYMHSDLGGFAGANLDDELYTRWLQYGVFQPIFRPHAQEDVPSEPIFREPVTKERAKKSIELRYRLLPYNYTLAYENNQFGTPLMRPLLFDFPENEELLNHTNGYMWGDSFFITPVLEAKKSEQMVQFPSGYVWYDLYTEEKFTGGQRKSIPLTLDHIPVYVKAGSFIPMAKPMQSTLGFNSKDLEVHYFYDVSVNKTSGIFYDDDGVTPDPIEKGKYELLKFKGTLDTGFIDFEVSSEVGDNYSKAPDRKITFILHGVPSKPRNIKVSNDKEPKHYDRKTKRLIVPVYLDKGGNAKVSIEM